MAEHPGLPRRRWRLGGRRLHRHDDFALDDMHHLPLDDKSGEGEEAAVVAAKLRRVLGEQAATTAEGVIIPLQVSVGWAVYPADGATAGELAHGAMRALRREKSERR